MTEPTDERLLRLVEPWDVAPGRELVDTPVFSLRERRAVSRDSGREGTFVYLDAPDWVNVIALTADERVVLIEQFRQGRAEVTLEIPGGMVDAGEDTLAAGLRELAEETGFVGDRAEPIGAVSPNPAIQNNLCHTLLVREVERRSRPRLDGNEEIGVRLLPLSVVPRLIREGVIHHALVVAAFHHLSLRSLDALG